MRSSFFEFHVAVSGLFTAKGNLNIASHNVANAATPGYSRQVAEQRASTPLPTFNGKGMVGTGSEIYGTAQIRNFYLDKRYWTEMGFLGMHSAKAQQLTVTQSVFNELSGTGLIGATDAFFDKLQYLTTTTNDATYRTNVVQYAQTLTTLVNNTANSLRKQQADINIEIMSVVEEINSLSSQIVSLNEQISKFELDGSRANDLRDQRANLVDKLSTYVNVDVYELEMNEDYAMGKYPEPEDRPRSNKRFIVKINGYDIVSGTQLNPLKVQERTNSEKKNKMDVDGLYDIYLVNGNSEFNIYSPSLQGQLRGLVDMRDGNNLDTWEGDPPKSNPDANKTTSFKGIPYYMNRLNTFVTVMANAINRGVDKAGVPIDNVTGHRDGYDFYGQPGQDFFVYDGSEFSCLDFKVNPEIVKDPYKLACNQSNMSGESENKVTLSWLNLKNCKTLFTEGKLSDYLNGMMSALAIDVKQAENFEVNYTDVIMAIDNQRIAVMGVDTNEEMINIIKYQQLYQASAKLVNIIDSIYDTTINKLGNF